MWIFLEYNRRLTDICEGLRNYFPRKSEKYSSKIERTEIKGGRRLKYFEITVCFRILFERPKAMD